LKAAVKEFLEQERAGVLAYAESAFEALPYKQTQGD
jgi:predicted N-acyltransferase